MSDPSEARLLEQTFRPVFAAAAGSAVTFRCAHDDGPAGATRPLPLVGLIARRIGDEARITHGGRPLSRMELRAEIRVDGSLAESGETAARLGETLRAALLATTTDQLTAWSVIDAVEFEGIEEGIDEGTRTLTLVWSLHTLPA